MKDSRLWLYDYERCALGAAGGDAGAGEAAGGGAVVGEKMAATGASVAVKKEMAAAADAVGARGGVAGAGLSRYGVLGIDEAGRGSLAGPVVAAAAYLVPQAYQDVRVREACHPIDDSKKLNRTQRDALFELLASWRAAGLLRIAAGEASVAEIEAHNIIGATALAMRRAVAALELPFELPAGECVKVGGKRAASRRSNAATAALTQPELFATDGAHAATDGTHAATGGVRAATGETAAAASVAGQAGALPPPHVWVDGLPMPERLPWAHAGVIGGDGASLAIAMASIWAKVSRDRLLSQLALEFPHYGWEANAGYGTAAHKKALHAQGACQHHRAKFLRKLGLHDG